MPQNRYTVFAMRHNQILTAFFTIYPIILN
jgi:hypothetical protein